MGPQHHASAQWLVLLCALLGCASIGACKSDPPPDEPPTIGPFAGAGGCVDPVMDVPTGGFCETLVAPTAPSVDCSDIQGVSVLRQVSHLGGALELTVRLEDEAGGPLAEDRAACLVVASADDCAPYAATVRAMAQKSGHVMLLIAPGQSGANEASKAAIERFLSLRPADERIALYRWGQTVVQITAFTTDRKRLAAQLQKLQPFDGPYLPQDEAIEAVRTDLRTVGGFVEPDLRSLVVLAPTGAQGPPDLAPGECAIVQWTTTPEELEAASARLDAYTTAGNYTIGVCGVKTDVPLLLGVHNTNVQVSFSPQRPLQEELGQSCDAETVFSPRSFTRKIEFSFDEAQRRVYDQRIAEQNKENFDVSIRISPEHEPVLANAHIRGSSTLACERKSYSVNLPGSKPRFLMPGNADDEFYLISMCQDDRYIKHLLGFELMKKIGAFDLDHRIVELVVAGQSQGIYLLLEKPKDETLQRTTRARSIIRRQIDIDGGNPEIKWTAPDSGNPLQPYDQLLELATNLEGFALETALKPRFDLDQYLRWVALMSTLENGDYIDEVYFIGTESIDETGAPNVYFSILGWDPDDLFRPCHIGGMFAIPDPAGMLYCTESLLDNQLFTDPHIYGLWVDALEEVMTLVDEAVFAEAAQRAEAELLPFFEQAQIRQAMVELLSQNPDATEESIAISEIQGALINLQNRFTNRRAYLQTQIQNYRAN